MRASGGRRMGAIATIERDKDIGCVDRVGEAMQRRVGTVPPEGCVGQARCAELLSDN